MSHLHVRRARYGYLILALLWGVGTPMGPALDSVGAEMSPGADPFDHRMGRMGERFGPDADPSGVDYGPGLDPFG